MINARTALAALALIAASAPVHADVTISTAATQNMDCSGGVCAPTSKKAVLNVTDLENLLASGSVQVTTTGSVEAENIQTIAAIAWSGETTLALNAHESVIVYKAVSVPKQGGMSFMTAYPGVLAFKRSGHVTASLSSNLSINGAAYTLVDSVSSLASAIIAEPWGYFALARNYDARGDGTYSASPVTTDFRGALEGLGNTISNLSIQYKGLHGDLGVGLFSEVDNPGTIANLKIANVSVTSLKPSSHVGGLAGNSLGASVSFVSVTGSVTAGRRAIAGGLFGYPAINLTNCFSSVTVITGERSFAGGVAGWMLGGPGTLDSCFAAGSVVAGDKSTAGGLIGYLYDDIAVTNSYATGSVSAGVDSTVGGFVGRMYGISMGTSYSTGTVTAGASSSIGGFVGSFDTEYSTFDDCYWDTTTSGTDQGTGQGNISGLAGLTTTQLQSGLPTGFDPKVWAENPNINNGFPYLIANPPPK